MSCNSSTRSILLYYFDENTFLTTLTSLTFAVIGLFIYIFSAYSYLEKQRIPTFIQPLAPFGHIKDVIFQNITLYECFWNYYMKCRRKRYMFGGMYLFFQPVVLLVDSNIQRILCENHDNFVNNKISHKDLLFSEVCNNFWTKFKDLKEYTWENIQKNPNISNVVHDCVIEATNILFGVTIEKEVLLNLIKDQTTTSFRHYLGITYPFLKKKIITSFVKELINSNIEHRKKNDVRKTDVLGNFINLGPVDDQETLLSDLFLSLVHNIVYAESLLFSLYELSLNSEVQDRLLQEIRKFKTNDYNITLEDIKEQTYLEAIVKETLRKYPPVPYLLKKCGREYENIELGLKLKKNTLIACSTFGIHYDSLNYPNPECFHPSRFLTENISDTIFLPFGFNSTGSTLIVTTVKAILFILLSRYKLVLTHKFTLAFDNSQSNVHPMGPLPIHLEFRKGFSI